MCIFDLLSYGICNIRYIEKNGKERIMKCTKNLDMIPKDKHPRRKVRTFPNHLLVFDFDKNSWFSFPIEDIICIGLI